MKHEKLVCFFLIISMALTVVSGKIDLPHAITFSNIIILICIGLFYCMDLAILRFGSDLNNKLPEIFSRVLLVFTCAFLVFIQSVHTAEILTAIKIMAIINVIYSIYLHVWLENKSLRIKHYLISFMLMGVSVFITAG